jgi:sirohydrochlorin ferrochelatase
MTRLLAAAAVLLACAVSASASDGVLLLAHGGDPAWNAEIEKLRVAVSSTEPAALALGMADPDSLQAGVDALAARGVKRIAVVPLFVNSRSEVMDQTRYALGLTDKPSEIMRAAAERMKGMKMPPGTAHHHMNMFSLKQVKLAGGASVVLAQALDDSPFVSRVLLERAKALSKDARRRPSSSSRTGPSTTRPSPPGTRTSRRTRRRS